MALSRDDHEGCVRSRIDQALLQSTFGALSRTAGFLVVGTKQMKKATRAREVQRPCARRSDTLVVEMSIPCFSNLLINKPQSSSHELHTCVYVYIYIYACILMHVYICHMCMHIYTT